MRKIAKALLTAALAVAVAFSFPVLAFDFSQSTGIDVGSAYTADAASTVKLNKTSVIILKGKSTTLKMLNTTKTVKWSSNDKTIATVSSSGKVTGKKVGTCTIYAKVGTKKYSCKVRVTKRLGVTDAAPVFTTYTPKTVTVKFVNDTMDSGNVNIDSYDESIIDAEWQDEYFDSNDNCKIKITPKAAGTTTIKISNNINKEVISIKVTCKLPYLNITDTSIRKGASKTLTLKNCSKTVTWTCDTETGLKLIPDGTSCKVVAKEPGYYFVTATAGGREYYCYVEAFGPSMAEIRDLQAGVNELGYTEAVEEIIDRYEISADDIFSCGTLADINGDGVKELITMSHCVVDPDDYLVETYLTVLGKDGATGEPVMYMDAPIISEVGGAFAIVGMTNYEGEDYFLTSVINYGDTQNGTFQFFNCNSQGLALMHELDFSVPYNEDYEAVYEDGTYTMDGMTISYSEFLEIDAACEGETLLESYGNYCPIVKLIP